LPGESVRRQAKHGEKEQAMHTISRCGYKRSISFAAITLMFVCFGFASDCQAQLNRGLFRARPLASSRQVQGQPHALPQYDEATRLVFASQHQHRHRATLQGQHWRNSNFYDLSDPYPKYYGGFHSSHFSKLGVPSGDLGFRGNNIFWSPW